MIRRPNSLLAALVAHAAGDPQRPCLIWDDYSFSYRDIVAAAAAWASHYTGLGLRHGDRVGLYLANGPAFLGAYLGAHAAGAAAVLINNQYRQVELEHILSDSEPRVVVSDAVGAEQLGRLDAEGNYTQLLVEPAQLLPPGVSVQPEHAPPMLPAPTDLAILAYTSGTTGRSKGAMLTHGCLAANSAAIVAAWGWSSNDRLLLVLPLFHIHGLGVGVHGTLMAGASLELRSRFEPAEVLARLRSGACSMFFGVPTIYTRLLEAARQAEERVEAGPVRLFVSGSAALSPQTFSEFEQQFGQQILERYGMTETGMNLTNPLEGERRPGTVGGPFPGQEARVVDIKSSLPLSDGSIGEIQVRGPHLFAGYWRNPEATAEVFDADGWFNTGDLGWRSLDGYYTLTGRARELIISGGYNIYPREVEELLLTHPGVAECAVLGMPDPDFGEQVVAVIVPTEPTRPPTPDELAAFCRERLAAYKRPRAIHFSAALPRNAMGKVQKHTLRADLP